MQIILENDNERASAREALEVLMHGKDFLADAWNQDLWICLAIVGFAVPRDIALAALRLDTTNRNRVQATMRYLKEASQQ